MSFCWVNTILRNWRQRTQYRSIIKANISQTLATEAAFERVYLNNELVSGLGNRIIRGNWINPDFPGGNFFPELLGLKRRLYIFKPGGAVTKQRFRGHKVAGSNSAWSHCSLLATKPLLCHCTTEA